MSHRDTDRPPDDDYLLQATPEPGESLLETIVRALAIATNDRPDELDPLYDYVNVDALERLVEHDAGTGLAIEFPVDEYRVVVTADGTVRIHTDLSTLEE